MLYEYAFDEVLMFGVVINFHNINWLLRIENDVMHNGDKCMVIILVIILEILHVIESHVSWCTSFRPVLVCSSPMVGI